MKLNERGNTLQMVLIVSAVISIIGYALITQYLSLVRDQRRMYASYNLQMIADNVQAVVSNDANWVQTVNANSSLSCLKPPGSPCDAAPKGPISVSLADGTQYLSLNANDGFDWDGNICHTYDAVNGDAKCVFQYTITWACATNPCGTTTFSTVNNSVAITPTIQLKGRASFSPLKNSNYFTLGVEDSATKASKYSFNFVRGGIAGTVSEGCKSLGGYITANGLCSIVSNGAQCTDGTYLKGINPADGTLDCEPYPFLDTRCNQGDGVTGLNSDGSLRCFLY